MSQTERDHPKKKKVKDTQKIVYLNSGAPSRRRVTHAVTHLSSDAIFNLCNLAIFLAQINFSFFFLLQQFSYMFVGNVPVSV